MDGVSLAVSDTMGPWLVMATPAEERWRNKLRCASPPLCLISPRLASPRLALPRLAAPLRWEVGEEERLLITAACGGRQSAQRSAAPAAAWQRGKKESRSRSRSRSRS